MKLRHENPVLDIYLVEDNALAYIGAAKLDILTPELTKAQIFRCDWPPNSLVMNMIESTWDDFKYQVEKAGLYKGPSQAEVSRVRNILRTEWEGISQEKIDQRCNSFCRILNLVQNRGNNNFNG